MTTNIIQVMKLETHTRALKKQGKTIRDIARILSKIHNVNISASAVFRFLKEDSLKQQAAPPIKIMKINLNPSHRDQARRPFTIWTY